jgi:hypothetical protein
MASRSSYNKSKSRSRGEENELVPVRSGIFYGIQTEKLDIQKNTINRNIIVTPNIIFYDNYTKCMIDFSDYKNNEEKSDIESFFKLLDTDYSFTISNAKWKNINTAPSTYDLGGTFVFKKIVEKIVFANVTSINSYNQKLPRYDKEYFMGSPSIEFSVIDQDEQKIVKSKIYNHLGKNTKNSFSYVGAYPGDFISIQNNDIKYKIDSIESDNEGKETITVFGELEDTNNIGTPILITLYQNNNGKIQLNYDNTALGKCDIYSDEAIVICIDNQTELQAKLRESPSRKITTIFTPGQFCSEIQSNIQNFVTTAKANANIATLTAIRSGQSLSISSTINRLFSS